MNRRDAIKVVGATAILAAVSSEAKMGMIDMNRTEMKPQNSSDMQKGELKHTPLITVKGKDATGYTFVEVTVGQGGVMHPSTQDHWIDFIELYANGKLVGRSTLEPEISRGATSFSVKLNNVKSLKAKAGCNLHGIWTSTISV